MPQPSSVSVALIQQCVGLDPQENLAATVAQVHEAARRGANIVCTQELFRSQYFCQSEDHANFDLAEPIPGPSTQELTAAARQHGIVVIGSLFERRAPGLYHNTAVVIDADGEIRGLYRKMHIPDDPLFYEKFYFTPGDLGFRAFDTKFGRIGVLICWDQWYPEGARLTALQGADSVLSDRYQWHPTEKAEYGERSTPRGRRSAAATRSPTACSWRLPTASAMRGIRREESSSGVRASSAIRVAASSQRGAATSPKL